MDSSRAEPPKPVPVNVHLGSTGIVYTPNRGNPVGMNAVLTFIANWRGWRDVVQRHNMAQINMESDTRRKILGRF